MKNINYKKLLIPNIPYVFIALFATKLGQAARLAPGFDFSSKVLNIMQGFSMAFENIMPSFHPVDLLVGIAAAVFLKLAVYIKGKNAKKFRKNLEYGSARWGTREDIAPFIDPVFENNVILTQTESLMLIVQDQVWNRVTVNREARKSTRYYIDEMHLLLKEEQTAAYSVEIWKRFRKWGGIPTGITQNVKDLLSSREVENIFENSDYIYMLNQASGDRQILAKHLNISPHQLSYVTHSGEGEGLLFYGSVILPFVDRFPKDTELYRIMTTKLSDISENAKAEQ